MINRRAYGCSGYLNGGICKNGLSVRREVLNRGCWPAFARSSYSLASSQKSNAESGGPGRPLGGLILVLQLSDYKPRFPTSFWRSGRGCCPLPLRARLVEAEREIEWHQRTPKPADIDIEALLPKWPGLIRQKIAEIERLAEREPVRARQAVRAALAADSITLRPSPDGTHLLAEYRLDPARFAAGSSVDECGSGGRI